LKLSRHLHSVPQGPGNMTKAEELRVKRWVVGGFAAILLIGAGLAWDSGGDPLVGAVGLFFIVGLLCLPIAIIVALFFGPALLVKSAIEKKSEVAEDPLKKVIAELAREVADGATEKKPLLDELLKKVK